MANEIRVLAGDGNEGQRLLLLFPIVAPQLKQYTSIDGNSTTKNAVPTPSNSLPGDVIAGGFLSAAEAGQLDAGTLAFRVVAFTRTADLDTNPKLVTRAQAIYAQQLVDFNNWYTSAFRYIGSKVAAP